MSNKKQNKRQIVYNKISDIFRNNPTKSFNYRQISHAIGLNRKEDKNAVGDILLDMAEQKIIRQVSQGKFIANITAAYITGTIDRQSVAHKTYLVPDDGSESVFIAERSMNRALNGDKVKVMLYPLRRKKELEGEVVEIIERVRERFVGIIDSKHGVTILKANNKQLPMNIIIPPDKTKGAKNGQKCIAAITYWGDKYENPIGEIVDILGDTGNNNTEMHAILAEYGLPYSYPQEIEKEANKIPETITEDEIKRRIDFRTTTTFTIDPRDAKDFDDALSIKDLGDGLWEVGVHIADVTHFVPEGGIIDQEAVKRATSVYLVDRTVPMLPEHLSNFICSLRPDEEKLTYSCIFTINDLAEVIDYKIARTVIKSDRRFTYEEAQEIIETGKGDFATEVLRLNDLAKKLREKRFASGAIAFERSEVRFEIDDTGKPVSVFFKESKDSNKLIEEFMLLANKYVAQHIGMPRNREKPKTFVYRIHDVPNPEKLSNFATFIKKFGYKIKTDGKKTAVSSSINHLLDQIEGKKEQNMIETLAIRSMAKAAYSTKNIGHYGLAMKYYTHFTSPIRRYPDMMVHRLLTKYADKVPQQTIDRTDYESLCKHSSDMEQLAAQAERASIKYKQIEFMADKIGKVYDGVISGISTWGIYVEINENKCEGMVYIRDLEDDVYVYDEKNYCIIGRRTQRKYQIGDDIRIRVVKADLIKKYLDFEIVRDK
ncbi:ribonuclease R [Bacteroidetes oral taxon 274 str. F0058]|nr:ribonuclease R [Bacteroidetes oral taxon 274 str. F0058]